jgi:hypothetical protein
MTGVLTELSEYEIKDKEGDSVYEKRRFGVGLALLEWDYVV